MPLQSLQTKPQNQFNNSDSSDERVENPATSSYGARAMALLGGNVSPIQRRNIVQQVARTVGNRQVQRLLGSIKSGATGGLKQGVSPEELGQAQIGYGGIPERQEGACGCGPTCNCGDKGEEATVPVSETSDVAGLGGISSSSTIERTIGDGHDLVSPRFSGDPQLEAAFDNEQMVRQGQNGEHVRKIQQALIDLGFQLPRFGVDGNFGSETKRAVKSFQRNSQLLGRDGDGVIGPVTMENMDNRFGAAAPAPTPNVTVTENVTDGPHHLPAGEFLWQIGWNTTGRNGFIVQEINNVYNAQNCDGSANNQVVQTPRYWEAWRVNAAGQVTPNLGAVNDIWSRLRRPGLKGNWTMNANVFFVNNLEPAANFVTGSVRDAGDLQSTTTQPGNLGTSLLTRHAGGVWDNCGTNNTHTPA
jgi:peptidoglycan hydrolase-like protein with peptidoglycan-binding domain